MKNFVQFLTAIKCLPVFILIPVISITFALKADIANTNINDDAQFLSQAKKIWKEYNFNYSSTNALDKLEQGARALQKDYPTRANGYQLMMSAMEDREGKGEREKARVLAKEMIDGSGPEWFKSWANGFLYRLDSFGKPVTMRFTAVDGREVDLAKMKGKVVLVDFWATTCVPCIAEMPGLKAVSEKFKSQGFEVIGISCDTDKKALQNYLERNGILWPQYFDGEQQGKNKFAQGFGVDGIPHMFVVDKTGCLRFDNLGRRNGFEDLVAILLAE